MAASTLPPPPPVSLIVLLLTLPLIAGGIPVSSSFSTLSSTSGPHIADLNVLLAPRMTHPVQYRLLGTGGCFSWTWDHHDILSVQPEYNGSSRCSTSARLVSIASYSGRKETAVYAADISSGTVIRCEVFIDKISRIQIFHHSVKLDLDGLATLHIRAFDDEENVFSSSAGLQFMWQLMPKSFEADRMRHHLVHVPLKETPLSDCGGFCGYLETQIKLEDSGVGSDLYVVKGIEIGQEIVTAHLHEPQHEHLLDKIVLTVAEAMSLDPPSPVFVIIGALIPYRLRIIRHNTPQAIGLPSPHHQWFVSNSTVAEVDSSMGVANALNLGITNVIVEDTRVSGHLQISALHVVVPAKLSLYIIPITGAINPFEGTKEFPSPAMWYVVTGQQYVIHMKAFSPEPDAKEIHITENDNLNLESNDSKYWDIFSVSSDVATIFGWKSSRIFKPVSQGQGVLVASLFYLTGYSDMTEVLQVAQEVIVCNKVKVSFGHTSEYSQIIRLPLAPGVYQEIELKATGGCAKTSKDYSWFSSDQATVSVSASGVVQAKSPGRAIIKAVSVFDSINYDEVVIEVSIPSYMVMLRDLPVEAVVGTHLQAAVSLKTTDGLYFHRCDAFSLFIRWKVLSPSEAFKFVNITGETLVFDMLTHMKLSEESYSHLCAWTYLHASGPGHAMLHATFSSKMQSSDHVLGVQIILQASGPIAAYHPLAVLQAGNGDQFGGYWAELAITEAEVQDFDFETLDELYLVPGTGMDVLLIGGPQRWDQVVEYIETVEILGEENQPSTNEITVLEALAGDRRLYRILCQTVGNFKLVFSRGNLVGDDHPLPVVSNVEMSLICSFPYSITLMANERASIPDLIAFATQADRGTGKFRNFPLIVANGCTIRLAAVGIHSSGRAFANSSSLCLRWELSSCEGLAHWVDMDSLEKSETTWERFLVLENATGLCTIRATVIGFSETIASTLFEGTYSLLESTKNSLTDAIRLQLVSSLRIIPETILLYFDHEAKANLTITGGTCFLDAVINNTQVAEIVQPPETARCSWLMIGARGLGTAVITIYDIGLSPSVAASAFVKVADVDWIKIVSAEEIFLMEGTTEPFEISAGTHDGSVFDSSQYFYMNVHTHLEDNILELVKKDGSSIIADRRIYGSKFLLRAENIGLTTLYVSVRRQSGHEIISQLIKVEVYAPLRIHPDYIFLVPGASYVLAVKGGPTVGTVVEYASLDDETATIHRSLARLTAISTGNTTVHVAVYGSRGKLICEAFGRVEVGIPSTMTLNLQSENLCIGCQMSIFPSFPKGNLFSFYEVCKDYKWTVEDKKVLSFQTSRPLHFDKHEDLSSYTKEKGLPYYTNDKDHGFINVFYGRSAGRTTVSVSFSCDFVSSGRHQSLPYNTSKAIRVVAQLPLALGVPITWILPPFYTTSDLLPGSIESHRQSDSLSHRSIMYSMLTSCEKNSLIQHEGIVISGPKIITRESNNLGCIQAKDQSGRTEIAACVRVAEVAQLRVFTRNSSFHVAYLALNEKLELVTGYCDDLGFPFLEAQGMVPLDVETNYPNVVAFHVPRGGNIRNHINENVYIQATGQGAALVRVSINYDPQKSVYVLVLVGAQIFPMYPVLHIGHFLNFDIIGDGTNGLVSGQWSSANESVISISRLSGEAHALSEGATEVFFEGSNLKLQTPVTVLRVNRVLVGAPVETLTNVPFPTKGYKFSVRFSDPVDHKFDATGTSFEVGYDCRVDPPFIGYVKPWSDHVTGGSYCILFPYSPKHLVSSISKFKDSRAEHITSSSDGFIDVTVFASLREEPHVMGSAHALFIGGFSISENKLYLTPDLNKTCIILTGNTDVELHWNTKKLLLVRPLDFGIAGHMEYEIKVLTGRSFTDKITIMLPATGQTVELDVSYDHREGTEHTGTSSVMWVVVLVCVALLILTVVIFLRLLDRPLSSRPVRQWSPPVAAAAGSSTPGRSPAEGSQSSPRTPPQAFLEHVRRTMDETPYYKRQGRRRFDPQYTY